MPHDSRKVSSEVHEQTLGSLGGCLVEGDPEQLRRERRVRRRALATSILTQTAALALLVLLPLFGKTEHIALAIATPIPPYGHPHRATGTTRPRPEPPSNPPGRYLFPSPTPRPVPQSGAGDGPVGPPDIGGGGSAQASGPECSWCIDIGGKSSGPRPPQPVVDTKSKPSILRITTLDPAMLIYRVDPIYPPLAKQIHKEGRVELRAIIATDGTIQSLEIVSGDPMFYLSAKEAVSQWRYRPTVLNGHPMEIDTYITVIYAMSH
jgi:periplasmic protein TonB